MDPLKRGYFHNKWNITAELSGVEGGGALSLSLSREMSLKLKPYDTVLYYLNSQNLVIFHGLFKICVPSHKFKGSTFLGGNGSNHFKVCRAKEISLEVGLRIKEKWQPLIL